MQLWKNHTHVHGALLDVGGQLPAAQHGGARADAVPQDAAQGDANDVYRRRQACRRLQAVRISVGHPPTQHSPGEHSLGSCRLLGDMARRAVAGIAAAAQPFPDPPDSVQLRS